MANLPSDIYEVRLYDHDFNLIGLLQGWSRLEYHQRINSPWNHLIEWRFGAEDTQRIAELSVLVPDMPILIYRGNVETGAWNRVYEGFHLTTVDQQTKSGDYIITLYGSGFTDLLNRRIVIPPANSENRTYSGNADYVMKSFVIDACTQPKPPEVSPYDTDRIMPNLTVLPFTGEGGTVEYSARYTNLLTILENLADEGNMRFGIVGNDHPFNGFTFVCKPIWGSDRRINSSNPNKGTPILFSPELDNMEIPILSRNYSDEKNVVYVGGRGVGTERMMLELTDVDAEALTPWSRKEAFSDSRGEGTMDGMLTAGKRYLEEYSARTSLTFNVRQTPGCQWIRDWNVGDIITAKYRDYLATEEITEVSVYVTFSDSAELIERVDVELKDLTAGMRNYLAEWTLPYYNPEPDEPTINIFPSGLNQMALFGVVNSPVLAGKIAITNNFQDASPTWTLYDVPGIPYNFAVDGFSYAEGTIIGWFATGFGFYRIYDLFGARDITTLATGNILNLDVSFIARNHLIVTGRQGTTGNYTMYARYSTDGLNLSEPVIISPYHLDTVSTIPDVRVSQHTVGKAFTTEYIAKSTGSVAGFVTDDNGATWAPTNGTNGPLFGDQRCFPSTSIHIPYNDNPDDRIIYFVQSGCLPSDPFVLFRTNADGSRVQLMGGGQYPSFESRWTMDTCPIDRQRFACIITNGLTAEGVLGLSTNAGDTITPVSIDGSPQITRVAISGDDPDTLYIGGVGYVGYSEDFGDTIANKKGDLPDDFYVRGFCGGTF